MGATTKETKKQNHITEDELIAWAEEKIPEETRLRHLRFCMQCQESVQEWEELHGASLMAPWETPRQPSIRTLLFLGFLTLVMLVLHGYIMHDYMESERMIHLFDQARLVRCEKQLTACEDKR